MKRLICTLLYLCTSLSSEAHTIIIETQPTNTFPSWFQNRKLTIYTFNEREHCIQIIDNPDKGLREALEQHRCLAGVNGGFFAADHINSPMGLVIQNGNMISPAQANGFWASGMVYDTGKHIRLERRQSLSTNVRDMKQALQSGPFLVEKGKVVNGLNNKKRDLRTFIATDNAGNWCIGTSSSLTLHELAEWLASSPKQIGFSIKTALNLDGGTSSGYYEAKSRLYIQPVKRVRNYLGIKTRRQN